MLCTGCLIQRSLPSRDIAMRSLSHFDAYIHSSTAEALLFAAGKSCHAGIPSSCHYFRENLRDMSKRGLWRSKRYFVGKAERQIRLSCISPTKLSIESSLTEFHRRYTARCCLSQRSCHSLPAHHRDRRRCCESTSRLRSADGKSTQRIHRFGNKSARCGDFDHCRYLYTIITDVAWSFLHGIETDDSNLFK